MTPQHPRGSFRVVTHESAPAFEPDPPRMSKRRQFVAAIFAILSGWFTAVGFIVSACWLSGACQ